MMNKKLIGLLLVGTTITFLFFIFKARQKENSAPPSENIAALKTETPESTPSPLLEPSPSPEPEMDEGRWKKELQKIQAEQARLRAQNNVAALSKFESLGYTCGIIKPETHVVKDQKTWTKLLQRMGNQGSISLFPDIDFNHVMIVAIFTGEQPFTEKPWLIDSHEFQSVSQQKKLIIKYRRQNFPKGSNITTMMTQPYHLKIFPLYSGSIKIQEAQ